MFCLVECSRIYLVLFKDDMVVILYILGMMGKLKGVMFIYQNFFFNVNDVVGYLGMNEKDKIVVVLLMFYVFCLIVCMNVFLMSGVCVLIELQFSLVFVFKLIKCWQVIIFVGVLMMYNYLY